MSRGSTDNDMLNDMLVTIHRDNAPWTMMGSIKLLDADILWLYGKLAVITKGKHKNTQSKLKQKGNVVILLGTVKPMRVIFIDF